MIHRIVDTGTALVRAIRSRNRSSGRLTLSVSDNTNDSIRSSFYTIVSDS